MASYGKVWQGMARRNVKREQKKEREGNEKEKIQCRNN